MKVENEVHYELTECRRRGDVLSYILLTNTTYLTESRMPSVTQSRDQVLCYIYNIHQHEGFDACLNAAVRIT